MIALITDSHPPLRETQGDAGERSETAGDAGGRGAASKGGFQIHPILAAYTRGRAHHSPSFKSAVQTNSNQVQKLTISHPQHPKPKTCPGLDRDHSPSLLPSLNPDSDNFPELVLNSVKKQSCRSFAAKLPLQRQVCSKFHFQPIPQILRKPPLHTPKRRYPLHPPSHTPNLTKKTPPP